MYLALLSFYDGIHALVLLTPHRGRLQALRDLPTGHSCSASHSPVSRTLGPFGSDSISTVRAGASASMFHSTSTGGWGLLFPVAWALGYHRFRCGDL